ncbi:MAG TPA: hypothetical protein VM674_01725 [Candidatus Acidoferrum sp.]|nr:hypothetical protein [Candidatus Acidoferrum sp.]
MNHDRNVESRIRRYAQRFRREANPRAALETRLMAAVRQNIRPRPGPLAFLPALAMAGGVLVAGLLIAFGAWQLRTLGHRTPTPPISLTTPTPSATPSASLSPTPSATPTPTQSGAEPGFVPPLASIQMVGPHLGWAVGSQGIYATTDGTHWTRQYASSDPLVGVDFISSTTGWAVAAHNLLGTTDGGRTWHPLGEAAQWIRSVHFVNPSQGWGIAGGDQPIVEHGVLIPGNGATVVTSSDGGRSWVNAASPANPETVCFSDASHGWLSAGAGTIYKSQDAGHTWNQSLQMVSSETGLIGWARIECAAPSALWVLWAPGGAAAGHSPYVVYATTNGVKWRTVMAEPGTIGNSLPGVPAGPGSYPGSFSVVDPSDAVFVGDTPPANASDTVIVSNGGATLNRTGAVPWGETLDAAFVSTSMGWVITVDSRGNDVIVATTDGGYKWAQQLAVGS